MQIVIALQPQLAGPPRSPRSRRRWPIATRRLCAWKNSSSPRAAPVLEKWASNRMPRLPLTITAPTFSQHSLLLPTFSRALFSFSLHALYFLFSSSFLFFFFSYYYSPSSLFSCLLLPTAATAATVTFHVWFLSSFDLLRLFISALFLNVTGKRSCLKVDFSCFTLCEYRSKIKLLFT